MKRPCRKEKRGPLRGASRGIGAQRRETRVCGRQSDAQLVSGQLGGGVPLPVAVEVVQMESPSEGQ